ncbi:MAG: S1C family serine protease [Oscillospiraceae bacterium]
MFDNYENNNNNSNNPYDMNEYSVYPELNPNQNNDNKKHNREKKTAKTIGLLLCAVAISVGSITGYRYFEDKNANSADEEQASIASEIASSNASENNDTVLQNTDSEPENNASQKSLIELASRENALSVPDIVNKVMPSVVGISSTFQYQYQFGFGQSQTQTGTGTGTGIIMSEDGYIITNAHVIYDEQYGLASAVSVMLVDETEYEATLVGYDTESDIAVLKIQADNLTACEFGNSDDLVVGELVIAIGNPLGFELFGSVTSGIVSALNRDISINEKNMTLIQTDAAINAGNSGGPLVNSYGQVIGINSAKMSSSYGSASVEGLGFAIPITDAKTIIDDLINYGYVTGRPQFGITGENITESMANYYQVPVGVYVRFMDPEGAAAKAGIQIGDIIVALQDEPVTTTDELNKIKAEYKAGDTVKVTVSRNNQNIDINVVLQEKKADAN